MTRLSLLEAVVAEVRDLDRRYRAITGHPAAGSDKVLAAVAALDANDAAQFDPCAVCGHTLDSAVCPQCGTDAWRHWARENANWNDVADPEAELGRESLAPACPVCAANPPGPDEPCPDPLGPLLKALGSEAPEPTAAILDREAARRRRDLAEVTRGPVEGDAGADAGSSPEMPVSGCVPERESWRVERFGSGWCCYRVDIDGTPIGVLTERDDGLGYCVRNTEAAARADGEASGLPEYKQPEKV